MVGEPPDTSAVANLLAPSAWSPGGQPAYNDTRVMVTAAADGPASEALVNTGQSLAMAARLR